MIHPLLHLIATKPQLIAEHLEAYAELVGEELGRTAAMVKRRVVLIGAGAVLTGLGAVFGGVALMLWAALPPAGMQLPWLLLAVPLTPLVLGVLCFAGAAKAIELNAFSSVKEQMQSDLTMLREVSTS